MRRPYSRTGTPSRADTRVTAWPLPRGSVALVTWGARRNEVDSEELAGRLAAEGWTLVDDAADADVAVVNTCGFVEQAKKDSIDALLEASDLKGTGRTRAVVAVGCLAERYGQQPRRRAAGGRRRARVRLLPRHVHPPARPSSTGTAGIPRAVATGAAAPAVPVARQDVGRRGAARHGSAVRRSPGHGPHPTAVPRRASGPGSTAGRGRR